MEVIRIILRIFWKNFKKFFRIKPEEYLVENLEIVRGDFESAQYKSKRREKILDKYLSLIGLREIKVLYTKKLSKKEKRKVFFAWINLCKSVEDFDEVENLVITIDEDNNAHYDYEAGKTVCFKRFEKAERIKDVFYAKRNFSEIKLHIASHIDRLTCIEIEKIKTAKEASDLKKSLALYLDYNFDYENDSLLTKWSKLFLEELSTLSNEGKSYQNNFKLLDDVCELSDHCPPVEKIENAFYEAWDNLASTIILSTESTKIIKNVYPLIRECTDVQELALEKWINLTLERIKNSKNFFDLYMARDLSPISLDDFDGDDLIALIIEKWENLSLEKLEKSFTFEDLISVYETSMVGSESEEIAYTKILELNVE